MTLTRPRGVRPIAGACLTLLLAVLLAPGSSRAGCVHDALRRSLEPAGSAHFRLLVEAGAMDAPADHPARPFETPRPDQPRPCSGPTCSNDSGLPPAPTASIAPSPGSWAWFGAPEASDAPGSQLRVGAEDRPRAVRRGLPVFHPPRPTFA